MKRKSGFVIYKGKNYVSGLDFWGVDQNKPKIISTKTMVVLSKKEKDRILNDLLETNFSIEKLAVYEVEITFIKSK